jgi:ABC-2 type transport system ATP-binding protein
LSKSFDGQPALRDVGFAARPGELLAVIGPNGAGKTTLLSIVAGIREPDAGELEIAGAVGWVPQQPALYRRLTVDENLRLFARLEGVDDVDATVELMLEQTALGERRDDQVSTLSGGNQQRINIAIGLLSRPAVLLLDEPSSGLDPRHRERLWDFILTLAGTGTTVIFATHDLQEADRHSDRLLLLADGEALFHGESEALMAATGAARPRDLEEAFTAFLRQEHH